jgi:hypothetical protein
MMPPMGMMGMGARPAAPRPTKPAIKLEKKLQPFNWRRVLVLPPGTAGKKDSVWDSVPDIGLNQQEIEELFENKVSNYELSYMSIEKRGCH